MKRDWLTEVVRDDQSGDIFRFAVRVIHLPITGTKRYNRHAQGTTELSRMMDVLFA